MFSKDRRRYKGGGGRAQLRGGGSASIQKEINDAILQGQKDLAERIDKAIRPPSNKETPALQPLPEIELPLLPAVPAPPPPPAPVTEFFDYTIDASRAATRRRANRRRGLRASKIAGETGGYQAPGTKTTLG